MNVISNIIRYFIPLIPISSLALAAQALYAWISPAEEISQHFFMIVSDLFVFELVFMHSSVFWLGRHLLLNGNLKKKKNRDPQKTSAWKQFLFGLFLFLVYGFFILPMHNKNPLLTWNYVILNILRFFNSDSPPWYTYTSFFKKYGAPEIIPALIGLEALLKLFYFAMFLPILVALLHLPDLGLNLENMSQYPTNENDGYGIIILTKSMFFYFISIVLIDILSRVYKYKSKYPELHKIAKL